MTLVRVLRGLPASGKTTWTLQRIHSAPTGRIARINNDDLIASIYRKTAESAPGFSHGGESARAR